MQPERPRWPGKLEMTTGPEKRGRMLYVLQVPPSRASSPSKTRANEIPGCFTSLSHGLILASSKAQEADASLQVLEYLETAVTLSSSIVVTSTIAGVQAVQASRDGAGCGLKCKTFTLWQTGGAHVNMPDYAEMPVSALGDR
jgi:hypothetical protein